MKKKITQKRSLDILNWNNWRQLRRHDDLFKDQEIILSIEICKYIIIKYVKSMNYFN